jgi:diguanylate cyclase (GGDEF)-like protein
MTLTDALTGLANRRRFDEALIADWARAERKQTPLALVMIDVDHFTPYNDRYGDLRGDEALRRVAAALAGGVRVFDLVARYGGDKFAIILTETAAAEAWVVADRVRAAVETIDEAHQDGEDGRLTVSAGVATWLPHLGGRSQELVEAADAALHEAKRAGRNRVHPGPG